jgi:hypothetical protein
MVLYQVGSGIMNLGQVHVALCKELSSSTSSVFATGTLEYVGGGYGFQVDVSGLKSNDYYLRAWVDANNDNLSEYVSSRRYLELDDTSQDVAVIMFQRAYKLSQQGCIAANP